MASAEEVNVAEFGDSIDQETFGQILQMDDDEEDREFSKGIVYDFFTQADNTFKKMDKALEEKDLHELSGFGHFLKGSSATLGLTKVKDCCEKIQHYGHRKDDQGNPDTKTSDAEFLARIKKEVALARKEYAVVEAKLRKFFGEE